MICDVSSTSRSPILTVLILQTHILVSSNFDQLVGLGDSARERHGGFVSAVVATWAYQSHRRSIEEDTITSAGAYLEIELSKPAFRQGISLKMFVEVQWKYAQHQP